MCRIVSHVFISGFFACKLNADNVFLDMFSDFQISQFLKFPYAVTSLAIRIIATYLIGHIDFFDSISLLSDLIIRSIIRHW